MNKFLIVCGPTATGKTKLGINLAQKFNGEILSADSRQVYQGMTIGTGKDISNFKFQISNSFQISNFKFQIGYYLINGIKLWLLDIVEPNYRFNVADYKKCAEVVLEDIWKRGKLPMIVGGTGFYIKAITEGIGTMGVQPDWEMRKRLSNCSIVELFQMLAKIDPERSQGMNESDRQNPRRLIRAIEVARNLKFEARNSKQIQNSNSQKIINDILFIGLRVSYETLYQRIDQRVEQRVKDGLEDEINGLLKKGYNWENSALGTTLAYREWKEYFEGKKPKEKVIQKWKYDEHNYARRQMTWFRKTLRHVQGKWFDIDENGWMKEVESLVGNWYTK